MSAAEPSPTGTDPVTTQHSAWVALVITGLIIGSAFIAVYVGLQRAPVPLHLPVAVAGQSLADSTRAGLGSSVDVRQVTSVDEGVALVRSGDVVAALGITSGRTLELDYAGAQGLGESSAARQLAAGLAHQAGLTVEEKDVVPLTQYDNRGLSAFYVVFGVTLSSFVLAQGLTGATAKVRLRARLLAMAGFAVVIGVVAATIAGPVYGSLTAPFPVLALSLTLLSAASAFATKALGAWLGAAGIGLAVLILTTIGNATSGAALGVDLLPAWARTLSPALPPGAAFRAVNDFGYFNGSHAARSLIVLSAWFVVGLSLVLLRQRLSRQRRFISSDVAEPVPAGAL